MTAYDPSAGKGFLFPLFCLCAFVFFPSCEKKPSLPPVPEGLTTLRITGPADRRVFFAVDYETIDGNSFQVRTTSGDQRLSIDGSPYELPLQYDPAEHTGLRVQVYATYGEPVTAALMAGEEEVESRSTTSAGEVLEIKYGELRKIPPPAFDHLRPNSGHQSLIDEVVKVLKGEATEFPERQSTAAFRKFGMLGVRALASALAEQFGPVSLSSEVWYFVERKNGNGFLEGVVKAGERDVVLRLEIIDGKLDRVEFLPPDETLRVPAHAEAILEQNSRVFLTKFFQGNMNTVEEMSGYKKQLTPEYFDMISKATVDYWKQGEPLKDEGLYVVKAVGDEVHLASVFSVDPGKSDYPFPQVWYAYYKVGEGTRWEVAEFFLINLIFYPNLDNLGEKVTKE